MPPESFDRHEGAVSPERLGEGLIRAENFFKNDLDLPIMHDRKLVTDAIRESDTLILAAETGSGKSTAGAVLIFNELFKDNPHARVAITEQRRPAIVNLAEFVGKQVGPEFVAYQHKENNTLQSTTQMVFTMEGTLLKQISNDPLLLQYDAVILDEVHERTISLDLLTPLLKEAQAKRREQGIQPLKIVMTSATLDREKLTSYFPKAQYVEVPGRTYHVERTYSDKPIDQAEMTRVAAEKVVEALQDEKITGHIMVFMPGRFEIGKTHEIAEKLLGERDDVELFDLMGGDESSEVFQSILNSVKRKVIFSSDVGKASLTIPGVQKVIVSGKMRTSLFDKYTGMTNLTTIDAPQDDIEQYVGRAGRTGPGFAHLLMTEKQYNERDKRLLPELLRTDLSAQVLKILELGIDIQTFDFIDSPQPDELAQANMKLSLYGALDVNGALTEIGHEMLTYDTNPSYARMLVEARRKGCLDEVALLVSLMNERSVFMSNKDKDYSEEHKKFTDPESDILTLINVWNEYVDINEDKDQRKAWGDSNGIWTRTLFNSFVNAKDLVKGMSAKPKKIELTEQKREDINRSIVSGLLDRILIKNSAGSYDLWTGQKYGIQIDKQSSVRRTLPDLMATGNLRTIEHSNKTFASFNTVVTEDMVREFIPGFLAHPENKEKAIEEEQINNSSEDYEGTHHQAESPIHTQDHTDIVDEHQGGHHTAHTPHSVSHDQSHGHAHSHEHHGKSDSKGNVKKFITKITTPIRKLFEYIKRHIK